MNGLARLLDRQGHIKSQCSISVQRRFSARKASRCWSGSKGGASVRRQSRRFSISSYKSSWFGDGEEACYAFPYYKDSQLVNIKYRTKDKKFRQENGAERTLFNIDAVKGHWESTGRKEVIIVEGEMDVLSMFEAGFSYACTLPDGAPKTAKFDESDKRFQALQSCVIGCMKLRRSS